MKSRARLACLAFLISALALPACDWIQFAFLDSLPFKGNPERNPEVNVYLGVDGLSYYTVLEAMKQGAFADKDWKLAKLVTAFPGTSDYSWTRTLHTEKLGGYENEYFDYGKDELEHSGLVGVLEHVTPTFFEFMNLQFEYLKSFDYNSNGYLSSMNAYSDTFVSLAGTTDALLDLLSGRVETAKDFSAYLLEFDVLGHMRSPGDATQKLVQLAKRLDEFRRKHPERRINFTLLSDHGMDFIRVKDDHFIRMSDELEKVGVRSVKSLRGQDPKTGPFAIPVMHTLVTYVALHTVPELIDEVAGRATSIPSVDLAVDKAKAPADAPHADLDWYNVWADGKIALQYGFDARTDEYYIRADQDYPRLDVPLETARDFVDEAGQATAFKVMTDDEVFALLKDHAYPDLFYRARTSLAPIGIEYPADIVVSMRPTWASLGFTVAGRKDVASAGFHGAMERLGTLGTLLTTERALPDAVRSDTLLNMFPRFKQHIRDRGASYVEGDPNASLHY
jgi:hypothetical protein